MSELGQLPCGHVDVDDYDVRARVEMAIIGNGWGTVLRQWLTSQPNLALKLDEHEIDLLVTVYSTALARDIWAAIGDLFPPF